MPSADDTRLVKVGIGLLAVLFVVEILVIAPHPAALALVATGLWMAWPGVALARRVLKARDETGVGVWLVGPALGLGLSVFGCFLWWAAGFHGWLALLLGPTLTWLVVALARRWGTPSLLLPTFDRRDILAIAPTLLVVPLITWVPYAHVREPVPEGEAYRAYFTADFVWGMTVTTELAKGDVPPRNPFLRGAPLRYYWMSHLLSGALHRNTRGLGATAEQVVLIDGLLFGVAATGFLYALCRVSGASPPFAGLAVAMAFLANSYEGVERIWVYYQQGASFEQLRTINIDAVTRWFYEGMPVDGLQRMLLYQPHHLSGYMLSLAALWLVASATDISEIAVSLWAGILLGLGLLFSTFTAIVVGAAVVLVFAARIIQRRSYRGLWQYGVLGSAPVVVALALTVALGYTDPDQGSLMKFGLNPVAARRWPLMLFLSFGPLLLGGWLGLARLRWVAREGTSAAALVLSALTFYFMVDVPDQGGVWVGWRSGHLLLIGFAVSTAAALTRAWTVAHLRRPLALLLAFTIVPAVPTVVIDVYNAQDVTNRERGPGFPWTLVVSRPEREALEWLRTATASDAVVQFEPVVRGAGWWCYLTAFAERRMAAGLPGAMIPFRPYQEASETVRLGIFRAPSATDAHAIATTLGIDYLFVGPMERQSYRPAIILMADRPDLFPVVFRNDVVTIYRVRR